MLSTLTLSCVAEPGSVPLRDAGPAADAKVPAPAPVVPKKPKRARAAIREPDAAELLAKQFPAHGAALNHMSTLYAAPRKDARVLGYMRRGAQFRASEEVSRKGCARGWFEVPGKGYVCNGDGFVIDSLPRTSAEAPVAATLGEALPYHYAKIVTAHVPQFTHLPTPEEERAVEAALANLQSDAGVPPAETVPSELSPSLRRSMEPGFYVSVDAEETDAKDPRRVFVRTVRGGYVRADKVVPAKLPSAIGTALGRRLQLPLAFVYRGGAPKLTRDPVTGEAKKLGGDVPLHSAHALTGETVERSGRRYYVTREGLLLRDTAVRVVEAQKRPEVVKPNERWIRVDLSRQTLTAYEGDTAVFTTLVSSGIEGHDTPTGTFRLHAKHVTATMADDLAADGPYSIEDVPWTMYFHGSYALHAAFWHERFGHQRSHGCVNLAPRDARWLFFWTSPDLPSAWHGVLPDVGKGTVVVIDPGGEAESGEQT